MELSGVQSLRPGLEASFLLQSNTEFYPFGDVLKLCSDSEVS